MAEIVLGIGSSHTPIVSLPAELWPAYAENDKRNPALLTVPDGVPITFDELLQRADPAIAALATPEHFREQHDRAQRAIAALEQTFAAVAPDSVVIIGDDQEELLFDDGMPSIAVYWGETMRVLPRWQGLTVGVAQAAAWGYGEEETDIAVDTALGRHLIGFLVAHDFDVAHLRYLRDEYGGTIGPIDWISTPRVTPPRPQGMPHAFSFVVRRIMHATQRPIVPLFLNTFYPPNQPTPRRCYALGRAIRAAIEAWDTDKRVAIVASGGLSHFVVDEELDRNVLTGLAKKDGALLSALPEQRLGSGTSEIRNWIVAGGACEHLQFRLFDYIAGYRTPAGTGGGWAFATWT